jgi:hypothetical protein
MFTRLIFAEVCLALAASAAPPLTVIQDVLYKADGTRFNGALTIAWNSFQASDSSAVVTQSTMVKVVDGNLRVQLVPSTTATPAGAYLITYNSDGRVQFQERWAVPSATRPLRVRDVRIAMPASTWTGGSSGGDTGTTTTGPVQESDVVGLVADLGARPVKGSGFAAGRVAMVNTSGLLDAVSGTATDCVRVDGSSGPCGSTPPAFVDGDAPSGIVDGANPAFQIATIPDPVASLAVYRNGLLQKLGSDYDFSGRTITFVTAAIPQPGDTLLASYRLGGTDTAAPLTYGTPQVLCSGTGASTNATSLASVGACSAAAGALAAGDRVEIRFDWEHTGTAAGFSFEVRWGGTVVAHRDASSSDVLASGRADAGLVTSGARLSAQSWGTVLPFAAGVASAPDDYAGGLTIDFQAKVGSAADTVSLRNFTVVRIP